MVSVEDLITQARPREVTVPVCLAGDLNARHEELSRQLAALEGDGRPRPEASLSDVPPQVEVARQIKALEEEMTGHVHTFVCRALPRSKYAELRRAHPPRDDISPPERMFNTDTFPVALVAASCVDPEFPSVEMVDELFDRLGQGAFDEVFTAAWAANTGGSGVPKSLLASATIRSTAPS